jgi:hypothetical protein
MEPDANHGVACTWNQQFAKYNELFVGCDRSIQKKILCIILSMIMGGLFLCRFNG